jgi:hypothetical protein
MSEIPIVLTENVLTSGMSQGTSVLPLVNGARFNMPALMWSCALHQIPISVRWSEGEICHGDADNVAVSPSLHALVVVRSFFLSFGCQY